MTGQPLTTARQAARIRQRARSFQLALLLGPAVGWLLLFFILPLLIVFVYSFFQRGTYGGIVMNFTLENYRNLLRQDYFVVFWRSIWLATTTTAICLLVGYPMAYWITRRPSTLRNFMIMLVIIPFWTNFLVRTYAWIVLLRTQGVVNTALLSLGVLSEPAQMMFTPGAVLVGMVYGFLPFMILPLYANLEKFDHTLMEAASDAGANTFWAFLRIMVPLTMPGIVAGSILVFIPAIGAFITPDILGGAKLMMVGNLIDRQFKTARDWPAASAVSISLMALVSIATLIYFRITGEATRDDGFSK
jgi:spermidine/putrescine transport system permease protein